MKTKVVDCLGTQIPAIEFAGRNIGVTGNVRDHCLGQKKRGVFACMLLLGAVLGQPGAHAESLAVPNGDFSGSGNEGSIGGGLLGGTASGMLGDGPWSASTSGILNLLAQPTVSITDGSAHIGGLAFLSVLGISNEASIFNHDIGHTFTPFVTYTLEVDFATSAPLNVGALTDSGVGVSLLSTGNEVATSFGRPQSLLVLDGNAGRLSVSFTASPDEDGHPIGISLFAGRGEGLADVHALGTVTFDNVSLTAVPEPARIPPIIGLGFLSSDTFGFSFATEMGRSYAVEYTDAIDSGEWQVLGSFEGTGNAESFIDPEATVSRRFYRVVVE